MRAVLYILVSFEDWRVVDTAIAELLTLFDELEEEEELVNAPLQTQVKLMHQLELKNVHFEYPKNGNGHGYGIGPIDLTVKKGECIFVVGGNGAGKSTLLKLITQLYKPQKGTVLRDFKPVHHWKTSAYQDLFSCIFTDFHLFSQLYGLDGVNEDHVQHLLEVFGIDHRVTLDQNTFQFQGLSTGQRKRLAMLQAFLENRSVYIFDEVAADQDPTYRQFFYEVILKDLKKLNKTVIAVSHDEHYFHVADRVLEIGQWQIDALSITIPELMKTIVYLLRHKTKPFLGLLLIAGLIALFKLTVLLTVIQGAKALMENETIIRLLRPVIRKCDLTISV